MKEKIFELINSKGILQKDFAKIIGITNGHLTDWKTGRSAPTITNLIKIADYFDVSLDYLCGRTTQEPYQVLYEALSSTNKSIILGEMKGMLAKQGINVEELSKKVAT